MGCLITVVCFLLFTGTCAFVASQNQDNRYDGIGPITTTLSVAALVLIAALGYLLYLRSPAPVARKRAIAKGSAAVTLGLYACLVSTTGLSGPEAVRYVVLLLTGIVLIGIGTAALHRNR